MNIVRFHWTVFLWWHGKFRCLTMTPHIVITLTYFVQSAPKFTGLLRLLAWIQAHAIFLWASHNGSIAPPTLLKYFNKAAPALHFSKLSENWWEYVSDRALQKSLLVLHRPTHRKSAIINTIFNFQKCSLNLQKFLKNHLYISQTWNFVTTSPALCQNFCSLVYMGNSEVPHSKFFKIWKLISYLYRQKSSFKCHETSQKPSLPIADHVSQVSSRSVQRLIL